MALGIGTPSRSAFSINVSSRKRARSGPSDRNTASSDSSHSAVSWGSTSPSTPGIKPAKFIWTFTQAPLPRQIDAGLYCGPITFYRCGVDIERFGIYWPMSILPSEPTPMRLPLITLTAGLVLAGSAYPADDYKLGPDSMPHEGVPKGKVEKFSWTSTI